MAHEVETMAYAGEVPWHLAMGLTTADKVKSVGAAAVDSQTMLKMAGLDWEVAIGPLYGGPKKLKLDNRFAVYRKTDGAVLGVVSDRYAPLQNAEAFAFLDSLVKDRVAQYVTAGSLMGGRRVWILMELGKGLKIAGDTHKTYVLFSTGHDAVSAIRGKGVNTRVVCNNTLGIAHGESSNADVFVAHNPQLLNKLAAAAEVLKVTTEEQRKMQEWLSTAADVKIGDEVIAVVTDKMFGSLDDDTPTQRRKAIEAFKNIYDQEKAVHGDTAYTVINAITGYADHGKRYQGDSGQRAERRFMSILDANGAASKLKAAGIAALETAVPELAKAGA